MHSTWTKAHTKNSIYFEACSIAVVENKKQTNNQKRKAVKLKRKIVIHEDLQQKKVSVFVVYF